MKVAKTLKDAHSWAASFLVAGKVESIVKCPHGEAIKIDIIWKDQVTDSIMACPKCWERANLVDKVE